MRVLNSEMDDVDDGSFCDVSWASLGGIDDRWQMSWHP